MLSGHRWEGGRWARQLAPGTCRLRLSFGFLHVVLKDLIENHMSLLRQSWPQCAGQFTGFYWVAPQAIEASLASLIYQGEC